MKIQELQALADRIPPAMLRLTIGTIISDVRAVYRVSQISAESIVRVARLRNGIR